ncbi:MAG: hypothetical protein JXR39_04520 [Marinilabiliaceae bacterium]|nr:hypothetical protein [Marinilabiliaceae bacterium]
MEFFIIQWSHVLLPLLLGIMLWDGVWKVIAMWHAARRNELGWFVCLAVFNTIGVLPIVYLLRCRRKRES